MLAIATDTETTGLFIPDCYSVEMQPRIIEISAVLFNLESGEIIDDVSGMVNPYVAIPRKITQLTGIHYNDVKDAPGWEGYAGILGALAQNADYVIAHNAAFDYKVIDVNCRMFGCENPFGGKHWICTMIESQWIQGKGIKMSETYKHLFDAELEQAHRARQDVDALIKIAYTLHVMGGLIP